MVLTAGLALVATTVVSLATTGAALTATGAALRSSTKLTLAI